MRCCVNVQSGMLPLLLPVYTDGLAVIALTQDATMTQRKLMRKLETHTSPRCADSKLRIEWMLKFTRRSVVYCFKVAQN